MILGMYMIINQTDTGQEAIGAGKKVAGAGLMLAAPEAAPEEAAAAEGAKVRTWTTTKPAGARTPARTFQTTQTTTRQPGGTHTRTVKQQLNDEARVHTSGNEPVSKLNTSTQGPPGWWRSA